MTVTFMPENLMSIYGEEERVREKALAIVAGDIRLQLHVHVTENAMNLADLFRKYPIPDEDIMEVQGFGMRTFNAFAAVLKLVSAGMDR